MADVKILEKARTSFFQDDDLIFINQNNALRQVPANVLAEKVSGLVPVATTKEAGLMTAQDKETLDKLYSRHIDGIIPAYKLDYAGRTAADVAADLLTYIKDIPGGATRKIKLGVGNVAAFVGYWNNNDDTNILIAGEWSALEIIGVCRDNDKFYAKLRLTNYNTNKTYESTLNASVFTPWAEMVTSETLNKQLESVLELIYPIGSLYWSKNPTDPAMLFGGTWSQIKDTFILAAGDDYPQGASGGEDTVTLTVQEMPSHSHGGQAQAAGEHSHYWYSGPYGGSGLSTSADAAGTGANNYKHSTTAAGTHSHSIAIKTAGGGAAHNNMPPYVTYYCWERIA